MNINEVITEALKLVTPSFEEESKVMSVANTVINIFNDGLLRHGYRDFEVTVQGSIAKRTWLPGDRDIDIFIVLTRNYLDRIRGGEIINDLIDIAMKNNLKWSIKYAQHPYIQLHIDDFEVDVVPCIRISPGEKPFTAADRTPLHTEFVKSKLGQRNTEVRLLKAFFKSVGIYGAEIKVQGFSGYVSELLILHYGSFLDAIKAMSNWSARHVFIDMTNTYNEKNALKKFRAPVIIIDPVDPNRNAAASITRDVLATAIAASREFLRNPRIDFFTRTHRQVTSPRIVLPTVVLEIPYPANVSPDIVWGEIKKLMVFLTKNLRKLDFNVMRTAAWSDDKTVIVLMLTFETLELPSYKLHKGPPVDTDAAEEFVKKYVSDHNSVGPFIKGSRWYVIKPRKFTNAVEAIKHLLSTVSIKDLKTVLNNTKYVEIHSPDDLGKLSLEERGVVGDYLVARPWWLL